MIKEHEFKILQKLQYGPFANSFLFRKMTLLPIKKLENFRITKSKELKYPRTRVQIDLKNNNNERSEVV